MPEQGPDPRLVERPVTRSAHPGHDLERRALARAAVATTAEDFPDLSSFQANVNLDALAAAYHAGQIAGVSLRAGWGVGGRDGQYRARRDGLRARKVPLVHYWFNYPSYNTPAAEAADFNATVGPLGPGEAMMADAENDPNARPWPAGGAAAAWLRAFLGLVQAPTNATWWYCSTAFVGPHALAALAGIWGWVEAAYGVPSPNTLGLGPICWQSSDCASVPGIAGCCDFNRVLRGPLAQWLTPSGGSALGIASAASDGDLVELHHLMQAETFGAIDPSGQQDFVNTVRAGVPLNAIGDGWRAMPQAQAYTAAKARLVAVEGTVDHLQVAGAPGVDPAKLQAALAQLAKDQQQVLADLQAAASDPAL